MARERKKKEEEREEEGKKRGKGVGKKEFDIKCDAFRLLLEEGRRERLQGGSVKGGFDL